MFRKKKLCFLEFQEFINSTKNDDNCLELRRVNICYLQKIVKNDNNPFFSKMQMLTQNDKETQIVFD